MRLFGPVGVLACAIPHTGSIGHRRTSGDHAQEHPMIAHNRQRRWTTACNDNGVIAFGRGAVGPAPTILCVAIEATDPIALRYVADGVLIISRG
jgi:hypothetical protein